MKIRKTYQIFIEASSQEVFSNMLGLHFKTTFENWTSIFNPTSTYEGNWQPDHKLIFFSQDGHGNKRGLIARVQSIEFGKMTDFKITGVYENGLELNKGKQVEQWIGCSEKYEFEEFEHGTNLIVYSETPSTFSNVFSEMWPKALERLKNQIEKETTFKH